MGQKSSANVFHEFIRKKQVGGHRTETKDEFV